jgi:hypothetical protein
MTRANTVTRFGPIEVEVKPSAGFSYGSVIVRPVLDLDDFGLNRAVSFHSIEEVMESYNQHLGRARSRKKVCADYIEALDFLLKEHANGF